MKTRPKTFGFNGSRYNYFDHGYNSTNGNERSIEVPIVMRELKKSTRALAVGLEVGNVLSHYYKLHHQVIDKYEHALGITNVDILDFKNDRLYDAIVSISTLEHLGEKTDPFINGVHKAKRAILHLKEMLWPQRQMIVTLPLGYNSVVDELVYADDLGFDETHFMQRIDEANTWRQVDLLEIVGIKYADPFPYANGVAIGIVRS